MTPRRITPRGSARVLRKAAAFIDAGKSRVEDEWSATVYHGACDVLSCKLLGRRSFQRPDLRTLFHATFVEGEGYRMMCDEMEAEEAQRVRVLALCFLAAMLEAGDVQ